MWEIHFFPEKLVLKKNSWLGLFKKPFLKLWCSGGLCCTEAQCRTVCGGPTRVHETLLCQGVSQSGTLIAGPWRGKLRDVLADCLAHSSQGSPASHGPFTKGTLGWHQAQFPADNFAPWGALQPSPAYEEAFAKQQR